MRKLIVSAWMSLDGVFDADTMPEWFFPYDCVGRQEYIKEGVMGYDVLLLGRKTYEMLAAYWSPLKNNEAGVADKLNSAPKFVVSSSLQKAEWNDSTIIKENIVEEITRLKQEPGREIQIIGSATLVHSLADTGLIDGYRFLIHPIVAGNGRRFFKDGMRTNGMKLVKTQTLDLGVVALCYECIKE